VGADFLILRQDQAISVYIVQLNKLARGQGIEEDIGTVGEFSLELVAQEASQGLRVGECTHCCICISDLHASASGSTIALNTYCVKGRCLIVPAARSNLILAGFSF
jgi:hypothetical protein